MDPEVAGWLADLVIEASLRLSENPGLTIEVDSHPQYWLQLLLESKEEEIGLSGFSLNFPYRELRGDPIATLTGLGLRLPPDTIAVDWDDGGYATIRIRADCPVLALSHLIGDILERAVGAPANSELSVRLEYGF